MIDRSYLPYESARFYQDRKMAKWTGFFLSEHSSSLDKEKHRVMYHSSLSLEEKRLLLNQLYTQQLEAVIQVQNKSYLGIVSQLSPKQVIVKTQEGYISILLQDITDIRLEETDESIRIS